MFEILEEGEYEGGDLVGIDYSPKAVVLAGRIAEERGFAEKVKFYVGDVIKDDLGSADWVPSVVGERGFDVVLDKGTFDAISLSDELLGDGSGRRVYAVYADKIMDVMKKGGLLVVTSCNWTEEELRRKLVTRGYSLSTSHTMTEDYTDERFVTDLEYHGRISYPTFSFGGVQGQAISSICLHRK